jgi:acyl carrier protein phosphodiesterase
MNYLGHIFLSNGDPELALANLFGDFIKGKKYLDYSAKIQEGILLHRSIDSYMDNHPKVKELTRNLYSALPKVAPIAVDLYFDHLLAKNWGNYHSNPYSNYLQDLYTAFKPLSKHYPEHFQAFVRLLIERDWMKHYPTEFGLQKMCAGLSQKISFENNLHTGFSVFKTYEIEIFNTFQTYMLNAVENFQVSLKTC